MTNSLEELIAVANVPDTWDVLIVGDGAGCWWDREIGWDCTLIDRHVGRRRAFYGGMSSGSILIAEMMSTLQAMLWYDEFHGHARKAMLRRSTLEIHVITDNETTVKHWGMLSNNTKNARKIRRKRPLWNALLQLERSGYIFHFHWIPRCAVQLNVTADTVAGLARAVIGKVPEWYQHKAGRSLDEDIYLVDASA